MRSTLLALALTVAAPSFGCVGSAAVSTTIAAPRLVWIAPGVWVVEDYDRAIFFYDDFYWWNSAGVWYRSDYYSDGFVRVGVAPHVVVQAYRPNHYVRYRRSNNARVRVITPRTKRPSKSRGRGRGR